MCASAGAGTIVGMPTPLEVPHHGPHDVAAGGFFPFAGLSLFFLLLLLAAATAVYLWRTGRLDGLVQRLGRPGPEQEAKRVLAERFANGDLSSEEFMERASVLNWTPGSESYPPRGRKRVGR
jgi:putative membrane protein